MNSVWKRIHAWLDENALAGHGFLRARAGSEAIQAAEEAMGLELRRIFRRRSVFTTVRATSRGLIGGEGWCLLPLCEIVHLWRKWSEHDPCFREYAPIAWNGVGHYLFLDLRKGTISQGCLVVQRSDTGGVEPLAASFRLWLEEFADALADGEFAYSEIDECLMYADEIELE
jgi:hypothetical protein